MEEQPVAQGEQLGLGHLLDLVGGVAGLDLGTERPSLDRLGQDGGRRPDVLGGGLVGGVQLAVVVAAPGQGLEFLVGEVGDQRGQARVGAEEVLTDVGAGLGGVLLELAVDRRVHLVEENAVDVLGQQLVPGAAPDDLDDVPARPSEERLELLDDLAVPRTGPSSRWRLQLTTKVRLSRCSRPAMPRLPIVSGSSNSPSPTKHQTRLPRCRPCPGPAGSG